MVFRIPVIDFNLPRYIFSQSRAKAHVCSVSFFFPRLATAACSCSLLSASVVIGYWSWSFLYRFQFPWACLILTRRFSFCWWLVLRNYKINKIGWKILAKFIVERKILAYIVNWRKIITSKIPSACLNFTSSTVHPVFLPILMGNQFLILCFVFAVIWK